ncbi:serine/threonine protein kinase [Actinocrispum sp. NPDC049592]|uniref:protein kinase domain-containing protein n=1 Tax=Actinocrispum sp. NPDC049592 TaxID=3154835 RepID=UPI00343B3713
MEATQFQHGEGVRPAPLPDCRRPGCSGRMLDHICVVCGASDKPGATPPGDWLTQEPVTAQSAAPSHLEMAAPTAWIRPPAPQPRKPAGPTLGAGLVDVPVMPYRDPTAAIMRNPMVAEEARFCVGCFSPVGRSDGRRPGDAEGRCFQCGTPFSFVPKLQTGDVVGAVYEVMGCLSYGGQGWIHLAKDHRRGEWVVLKGMIHTGNPEALAAAMAEQQFLREVDHPNVVKIHDFVWHERAKTNFLVMEYLGGPTLRDIALNHYNQTRRALPDEQVIAYGLEILSAFGYLHSVGLLYCDLKPSNVLQVRDQVKLIDLGGMRRIGDNKSPLIHTAGFAAPELGSYGPSIASDLYAVGRTMAALSTDFESRSAADMNFTHTPSLSPYHRVLEWATHPDPAHRPRSAEVMAHHLKKCLTQ